MTKIIIEIKNCSQCPHHTVTDVHSDGFDRGEDWYCKKANKKIAGYVEWHDNPKVPEWCPIIIKDNQDATKQTGTKTKISKKTC